MQRSVLALGIFVAACAPPTSMRPASSTMGDTNNEVGAALVSIRPRPFANDPVQSVGQFWGTRRFTETVKVSGIVAFDGQAAAAGTSVAWLPFRSAIANGGVEVELGYAWFGISTPWALRLGERVTLHTSPRLGSSGDNLAPALPAGVSIEIAGGFVLRSEAQISWVDFKSYNRRVHWGLGIAYKFGKTSKWANTGK